VDFETTTNDGPWASSLVVRRKACEPSAQPKSSRAQGQKDTQLVLVLVLDLAKQSLRLSQDLDRGGSNAIDRHDVI